MIEDSLFSVYMSSFIDCWKQSDFYIQLVICLTWPVDWQIILSFIEQLKTICLDVDFRN
jgi:hypothetical protein